MSPYFPRFLSWGWRYPPSRVFLGKLAVFNGLATVICRKCFVLRSLDTKILKTENLFGGMRGAGLEAMPRPGLRTRYGSLNYRLAD